MATRRVRMLLAALAALLLALSWSSQPASAVASRSAAASGHVSFLHSSAAAAAQAHLARVVSTDYVFPELVGEDDPNSPWAVSLLYFQETPGFFASAWAATKNAAVAVAAKVEGKYDAAKVRLLDAQIAAAQKAKNTALVTKLQAERATYVASFAENQKEAATAKAAAAKATGEAKAAAKQAAKEVATGAKALAVAGVSQVKVAGNAISINTKADKLAALEKAGKGNSAEAAALRKEISAASAAMSRNEAAVSKNMATAKANIPGVVATGKSLVDGTVGIGDVAVGSVKTVGASVVVAKEKHDVELLQRAGVKETDPRMIAARKELAAATAKQTAAKTQVKAGAKAVAENGETMVRTAALVNPVLAAGVATYDVTRAGIAAGKYAKDGNWKAAAAAAGQGVLHAVIAKGAIGTVSAGMKTAKVAAAAEKAAVTAKAATAASTAAKAESAAAAAAKTAAKAQSKVVAAQAKVVATEARAATAATKAAAPAARQSAINAAAKAEKSVGQAKAAAKATTSQAAKSQANAASAASKAAAAQKKAATAAKAAAKAKDPAKMNILNTNIKGKALPKTAAEAKAYAIDFAEHKALHKGAHALHGVEAAAAGQEAAHHFLFRQLPRQGLGA